MREQDASGNLPCAVSDSVAEMLFPAHLSDMYVLSLPALARGGGVYLSAIHIALGWNGA